MPIRTPTTPSQNQLIQGVSGNGNGTLGNSTPVGAGGFFGNPDVVTTSIATTNKLEYLGTARAVPSL
jgi:hypothetical protein